MFRLNSLPLNRLQEAVKNGTVNAVQYFERITSPIVKKCEGTVFEKAGTFLKNVAIDYKEVFVETYDRTKTKPFKASLFMGVLGFGAYCGSMNPDESSFRDALLSNQQKLMMLADSIRNPVPVQKLKELEQYYNQGRMRIFRIGVVSFMWVHDNDESSALYEAQCEYLTPTWSSYPSRVVDIGFLGKWWVLSQTMADYDVNPEEFKDHGK